MQEAEGGELEGGPLIPSAPKSRDSLKRLIFIASALVAAVAAMAAVKPGALAAVKPASLAPELVRTANELRDRIVAGSKAADWVRDITDLAGPRMPGSAGDRAAVAVTLSMLKAQGFANVRAEKVVVPVWERGVETGEVLSPVRQKLVLTALGGSIGTPEDGLEGEVVRFRSLEELALAGGSARGKIAFIDRPTARTSDGSGYGSAGDVRGRGPSASARQGAIGLLIRSIGTDDDRAPHTGGMRYEGDASKIPAAALAAPDAALLTRLLARGPVKVKFTLGCRTLPDGESANVIGEIPGRELPKEIVLLGAHLDSWDLGTGALDDAAGCGIVIEAARQIAQLPQAKRPRRTLRVVLFANEEHGLKGGKEYAEAHAAELADHVAALEADLGQGPPLGFSWNAGPSAKATLEAIAGLLAPIGADALKEYDVGGADLIYLLPSGIPSLGLSLDATDYFDYHHTANDNFDRIDPKILDRSTAAAATLAYALAEIPAPLERIVPEKRALPSWAR
jgi:carboxypeptidase Q